MPKSTLSDCYLICYLIALIIILMTTLITNPMYTVMMMTVMMMDVCSPDVDSLDEGVERPCLMMTIPRNEPREHRTSNDLGSEVLPGISRVSSSLPWGPGAPAAPFSFFSFPRNTTEKKPTYLVPRAHVHVHVHSPSRQDAQPPVPWRHNVEGADFPRAHHSKQASKQASKQLLSLSVHSSLIGWLLEYSVTLV